LVLPGEWNRVTVRCSGGRVAIAINGVQTADFAVTPKNSSGPIVLAASSGEVEFRELWVKPLD
jgi:hypothetical protein